MSQTPSSDSNAVTSSKSSPMMSILVFLGVLIALGLGGVIWFMSQLSMTSPSNFSSIPEQQQIPPQRIDSTSPEHITVNNEANIARQQTDLQMREDTLERKQQEQRIAELKIKEDELRKKEDALKQAEYDARERELAKKEQELADKIKKSSSTSKSSPKPKQVHTITLNNGAGWYQVNAKPVLRVRSSPRQSGKIVGKIPNHGKIKVLKAVSSTKKLSGRRGQWVEVEYQNIKGYVFSGFLLPLGSSTSTTSTNSTPNLYKVKAHPHLNIRSAPDVTGKIIGKVKNGKRVQVLGTVSSLQSIGGKSGYWVKVKGGNKIGYTFDAFLEK